MTSKRNRHSADQIVKKLRDADAMLRAIVSARYYGPSRSANRLCRVGEPSTGA
ncbi:hypothetical protein VN12_02860 [Pirellula sp. SH-Sr6A]|nr:hypothetical protein VN12_02860 [Pirellula sp. SH-Sr6A]